MKDQSLREFVITSNLPSRVKVTEGLYNTDWEFSNGDVLDLIKLVCPSVDLRFIHPDTGEERAISVSTQSPCLYKIMPYIPDQPMIIGKPLSIHGVVDLIRIWPSVVCTRTAYHDPDRGLSLMKGEKLRLKRLISKHDKLLLECSLASSQLVVLPIGCDIEFLLLEDTMAYTLAEIADMQGRVERRLRLSEDTINKTETIHGLPRDFVGDLIMLPARRFVEIHPESSPGEHIVAPIDLDISVSERDDDYYSASFIYYELARFVDANCSKFPMVVSIAQWTEEPVTLQAIRASVGDRIVLYKVEEIMKVACEVNSSNFVIPLTYDAVFQAKPCVFTSIGEAFMMTSKTIKKLRVMSSDVPEFTWGDIIEIQPKSKQDINGMVKVNKLKSREVIKLPMDKRNRYEEVLDLPSGNNGKMTDLNQSMLPLIVVFPDPAASFPPRKDAIPRGQDVDLLFIFKDTCVRTSKNIERSPSSPIPIRSDISIRYISQYKKRSVVPELSKLSSCPEQVIDEEKFLNLRMLVAGYENADAFPEQPPPSLLPRDGTLTHGRLSYSLDSASRHQHTNRFGLSTSRDGCPLPETPAVPTTLPTRGNKASAPHGGQLRRTVSAPGAPPIPPRASKQAERARIQLHQPVPTSDRSYLIEDEIDYEDVGDLKDYSPVLLEIFGDTEPPSITTPADADLSGFSWADMVVFLQLTGMPPNSLRKVAHDKISGHKFASMDRTQLRAHGIDYPIIRHYWNKSKPAHKRQAVGGIVRYL